jgi:hypothetical protein
MASLYLLVGIFIFIRHALSCRSQIDINSIVIMSIFIVTCWPIYLFWNEYQRRNNVKNELDFIKKQKEWGDQKK